jgi:hypothetical protein
MVFFPKVLDSVSFCTLGGKENYSLGLIYLCDFHLRSLTEGETVNILAGLVWFSPQVGEALLKLHCFSPIDGCTYLGVDSGEPALQVRQ